MPAVQFTVTLLSPLSILAERKSKSPACTDHVPGSTLRGALMTSWRRRHGEDDVFYRLMSPGRNVFPFLWPGPTGVRPLPASAVTCKSEKAQHGVEDILLARARALAPGAEKEMAALNRVMQCPHPGCGSRRHRVSGYRVGLAPVTAPVRTFSMHVGIERRRGTAAPHVLYGMEAVAPSVEIDGQWQPTVFSGQGYLHSDDLSFVKEVVAQPIYLGKGRSRGQGEARIVVSEITTGSGRPREIAAGCAELKKRMPGDGELFTVDVLGPIINYDRYLRAQLNPAAWLPAELASEVLDSFLAQTVVSGWDMAAGIPKDDELAVAPGSVVLARSTLAREKLVDVLAAVEQRGLGERLGEGFGQIVINDSFRLQDQR